MNPALYEARAAVSEKVDLRDSLNDSRKVMELDPTNPKVRNPFVSSSFSPYDYLGFLGIFSRW